MGSRIQRTARVKLRVNPEDEPLLKDTFHDFRKACQHTVDYAWENRDENNHVRTSKKWLQENTYEQLKQETNLNTGLIQKARDQAVDSLKQVISQWSEGNKASKPQFESWFVAYDNRTITYTEEGCSLATTENRVKAEFVTSEGDNPQSEYLSEEWEKKKATLHHEEGDYYLHVNVVKEIEEEIAGETESGTVLGVDLNVTGSFAVTSTGLFIGSSDHLNHKRNEYEQKRSSLQETGTRNAHETIKRIGSRFARWSEQKLHEYSNQLLEEAQEHDCKTIVFEKLKGIRENMWNNKKFQQWAFNKFIRIVDYKAKELGIKVELENPENTSKTCSYCGHVSSENRKNKHDFKCVECGYEVNADYNAAKNVGMRFVHSEQKSQSGRAKRQLALKSGTMKPSGGISPTQSNGLEAEYTNKPLLFKER